MTTGFVRETRREDVLVADYFTASECTLDGERAKVTGRFKRHAMIVSLESSKAAEFSWSAVARIMANGRLFKS